MRTRPIVALVLLAAACHPACGHRFDVNKFDAASREFRSLETAVTNGVNALGLEPAVRRFEAEVATLGDRVTTVRERTVFKQFAASAEAFRDSATLWDEARAGGWIPGAYMTFPPGVPEVEWPRIATAYSIPRIREDNGETSLPKDAITRVWDVANERGQAAILAVQVER